MNANYPPMQAPVPEHSVPIKPAVNYTATSPLIWSEPWTDPQNNSYEIDHSFTGSVGAILASTSFVDDNSYIPNVPQSTCGNNVDFAYQAATPSSLSLNIAGILTWNSEGGFGIGYDKVGSMNYTPGTDLVALPGLITIPGEPKKRIWAEIYIRSVLPQQTTASGTDSFNAYQVYWYTMPNGGTYYSKTLISSGSPSANGTISYSQSYPTYLVPSVPSYGDCCPW
jgi:hypothetical protein